MRGSRQSWWNTPGNKATSKRKKSARVVRFCVRDDVLVVVVDDDGICEWVFGD